MATAVMTGEAVPPYDKKKTIAVRTRTVRMTVAMRREGDGGELRNLKRAYRETAAVAPITVKIIGVATYIQSYLLSAT
jgi:hypothetical protein